MEKLPWRGLRIDLVKVREEGGVSELLEARGVVRHDVSVAGEVVGFVAVAVESLVGAGVVA